MRMNSVLALAFFICQISSAANSQQENTTILIPGNNAASARALDEFIEATANNRLGLPSQESLIRLPPNGISMFKGNAALDGFAAIDLESNRILLEERLVTSAPDRLLPDSREGALDLMGLGAYEEFLFSSEDRMELDRISRLVGDDREFRLVRDNRAITVIRYGEVYMITGVGGEVGSLPGFTPDLGTFFENGLSSGGTTRVCGEDTADPWTHCALYAVKLTVDNATLCSGTMLSPHHVLTAAHCVCDAHEGQLPESFRVVLGQARVGREIRARSVNPVSIYPGLDGGACDNRLLPHFRQRNGDLAIVHLEEGAYSAELSALTDAMDPSTAKKESSLALAAIGQTSDDDWTIAPPNRFAVIGFGRGVDLAVGVKRAEMITLRGHVPCTEALLEAECAFRSEHVKEAIFQDNVIGLCESDSGAGIYKPASPRQTGYGYWSVVGVVSGGPEDSTCHEADLSVLASQSSRVIVRLDAPETREWLEEILAENLVATGITAEFDSILARGGNPEAQDP